MAIVSVYPGTFAMAEFMYVLTDCQPEVQGGFIWYHAGPLEKQEIARYIVLHFMYFSNLPSLNGRP